MYRDTEAGFAFHGGHLARSPFVLRLVQAVNALFALLYAFLALEFLVVYVQAGNLSVLAPVEERVSPFLAQARTILPDGHDPAGHPVAWSIVACMLLAVALNVALVSLLRSVGRPPVDLDD